MKNRTRKGKSPLLIFTLNTLSGLLLTLLLTAAAAFYITRKDVAVDKLPYFLIACAAAGCFLTAFLNAGKLKMRGIISGLISALIFSSVFLLLVLILGGFSFSNSFIVVLAADLIVGSIGGVLAKNLR